MHEIRHVIARMRLGKSDRDIARAGAMGRPKAAQLRALALEQGWRDRHQPSRPTMSWNPCFSSQGARTHRSPWQSPLPTRSAHGPTRGYSSRRSIRRWSNVTASPEVTTRYDACSKPI